MRLLLVLAGLLAAGCVRHEAEIVLPAVPGDALRSRMHAGGPPRPGSATAASVRESGAMPIAMAGDAWWIDAHGALHRDAGVATTPTPWWQRFPADLVTDLMPWEQPVRARVELAPRPVQIDPAALTAAARAAGYATP